MTEGIDFNYTETSHSFYSFLLNTTQLVRPWKVNMRGQKVKLLLLQSDFQTLFSTLAFRKLLIVCSQVMVLESNIQSVLPTLVWSHWLFIFYRENHAASCQTMETCRKVLSVIHSTGVLQEISVALSLGHLFIFRKPVSVHSNFPQDHKRRVLSWAICRENYVISFHLSHKNTNASVSIFPKLQKVGSIHCFFVLFVFCFSE